MILITSSGPVGVKYMVDGLGALPKYYRSVLLKAHTILLTDHLLTWIFINLQSEN